MSLAVVFPPSELMEGTKSQRWSIHLRMIRQLAFSRFHPSSQSSRSCRSYAARVFSRPGCNHHIDVVEPAQLRARRGDPVFRLRDGWSWFVSTQNRKSPIENPKLFHRITRSARANTFGGIVSPICLAAFRSQELPPPHRLAVGYDSRNVRVQTGSLHCIAASTKFFNHL
jgi:hypothetical protein